MDIGGVDIGGVNIGGVDNRVPYAELHCHSNFSFLDGASHPEELVTEAVRLGLDALALTDHDGLYGVVRFARAAADLGLPTVFGPRSASARPRPRPRPRPWLRLRLRLRSGRPGPVPLIPPATTW